MPASARVVNISPEKGHQRFPFSLLPGDTYVYSPAIPTIFRILWPITDTMDIFSVTVTWTDQLLAC